MAYNPDATGSGGGVPPGYPGYAQPAPAGYPAAMPTGYPAAQPYAAPAQPYPASGAQPYGAPQQPYGGQPYAAQPYASQPGYAAQPYAAQPVVQQQPYSVAPIESRPMMAPPAPAPGGNTFFVEGETVVVEDMPSSETLSTDGCGTTKLGKRLDLDNREYQDVWAAILFGVVIICLFVGLGTSYSGDDSDGESGSNGEGIGIVLLAGVVGLAMGFVWLHVLKKNAEFIIKAMLLGYLGMFGVFTLVALLTSPVVGVFMLIFFGLSCLYVWCNWPRVILAAALIGVSAKVVQEFPATVGVTISMLGGAIAYILLWSAVVVGYSNTDNANGFVVLMLLVCGYWGLGVAANVSHYTTLAVTFQYYFNKDDPSQPTWKAFQLATTKSFGSICLGSLIVAVIQTLRALARQARERGSIAGCIMECLLACLESWARFFNLWAYSYCALYGMAFREAGGAMWDLFQTKGMSMIAMVNFSGFALMAGALVGGLVAGVIGFLVGTTVCNDDDCSDTDKGNYGALYGLLSLIIGYYTCWLVMLAVRSGVVGLFTAWAEDPGVFFETHPKKAKRFADAWNKSRKGVALRRCG